MSIQKFIQFNKLKEKQRQFQQMMEQRDSSVEMKIIGMMDSQIKENKLETVFNRKVNFDNAINSNTRIMKRLKSQLLDNKLTKENSLKKLNKSQFLLPADKELKDSQLDIVTDLTASRFLKKNDYKCRIRPSKFKDKCQFGIKNIKEEELLKSRLFEEKLADRKHMRIKRFSEFNKEELMHEIMLRKTDPKMITTTVKGCATLQHKKQLPKKSVYFNKKKLRELNDFLNNMQKGDSKKILKYRSELLKNGIDKDWNEFKKKSNKNVKNHFFTLFILNKDKL